MDSVKTVVSVFKQNGMEVIEDPDLPTRLAETLFSYHDDSGLHPAALCFYTDGGHLCVKGLHVFRLLRRLEPVWSANSVLNN